LRYWTATRPRRQSSVCGLGSRKDELVKQEIAAGKVEAAPGSVTLLHRLRDMKMLLAVVSSSNNCEEVLEAAGIADFFPARVDGIVAAEKAVPGKPYPDTFLHAAHTLNISPDRAVVIEDALAGVEAGCAGRFGLVVGVDRGGSTALLRQHGADITDRAELVPH